MGFPKVLLRSHLLAWTLPLRQRSRNLLTGSKSSKSPRKRVASIGRKHDWGLKTDENMSPGRSISPALYTVDEAARKGFSEERRRMSAEFAAMRREELRLFNPQSTLSSKSRPTENRFVKASKLSMNKKRGAKRHDPKVNLHIQIIQVSEDLICINKPPSILSQPGLPGEGTILELLQHQRPDLTVQTVNRLDKNTSGAMVLGRTDSTVRELNLLFKENQIEKNYLALLKPKPGSPLYTPDMTSCRVLTISADEPTGTTSGVLTKKTIYEIGKLYILQDRENTSGYILTFQIEDNSASITHFHVLSRLDPQEKLLVQFTPLTGKKHQLRLHSAFLLGAPVVGDHRYGYPQDDGLLASPRIGDRVYKDGYALHCYRIATGGTKLIKFDVMAEFPTGRWGDIWDCVRLQTESKEFLNRVREVSQSAREVFQRDEVRQFLANPKLWAKGIRGQLVKKDI